MIAKKHHGLTAARLREILHYNPDTGEFTYLVKHSLRSRAGLVTKGSANGNGYFRLRIDGHLRYVHRLAWLYMTGQWAEVEIDHINGDGTDNRFCNLRLATRSQNARNTTIRSDNRSGFRGVHWNSQVRKWQAEIKIGKRRLYLGRFSTPEAGREAYCKAAREHFGEYARAE